MNVVIYGAGSIGCYIGTVLVKQFRMHKQHSSATQEASVPKVTLLGRERLQTHIQRVGAITLTDFDGRNDDVVDIPYSTDLQVLAQADIILVTLKCTQMGDVAVHLSQYCRADSLIVCLQNGVGSEQPLVQLLHASKAESDRPTVRCGIVPFNVVQTINETSVRFHRATEGSLHLPYDSDLTETHKMYFLLLQSAYLAYGLGCDLETQMSSVMWGKLLLNLNNAINALSDLPLKAQLSQRGYRRVLAQCQQELLAVCQAKQIELAKLTAVQPRYLPMLLKLPDFLFKLIAQKMLAIDPEARSSMWEDVQANRVTEIDFLNGAVVRLGEEVGIATPANQLVAQLIKALSGGDLSAGLSSKTLLTKLQQVQ